MRLRRTLLFVLCTAFAGDVLACAGGVSDELLGNRQWTLDQLPEGTFDFEAAHLLPKPAGELSGIENGEWLWNVEPTTRDSIERGWLGTDFERVQGLRGEANAALAYEGGEGIAEDARRYVAGAVAWAHKDYAEAQRRFASVLELAPAERANYGLWAQYMLGEVAAARGDTAAAIAAYQATRAQALAGAADPQGVALTSLGQEALLHLKAGEDAAAIALYAEQAARESAFGRASLLRVARAIARDPQRLERAAADPLSQRVLTAYLLTRFDDLASGEEASQAESERWDGAHAPGPSSRKAVQAYLAALDKQGVDKVAGADRIAALAYRNAEYAAAKRWVEKAQGPLAAWIRAKLALRDGNVAAANQAYAEAAKAFPADERWGAEYSDFGSIVPQCRVEGEQGTLALMRGEFLEAMDHLYKASAEYWSNAAYVAERVLTVDELKAYVDQHVPAPAAPPANGAAPKAPAAASLRNLLARRLLRAGRYAEALGYFDTTLQPRAQAYVDARTKATKTDGIERAQALFAAASAARNDGMEILGFELGPDNQIDGGSFEGATEPPKALVTAQERERVAASRAVPDKRYHYRYVAADLAGQAADLVPARSQAYAAMLCEATRWLLVRDPEAATPIYRRYVQHGAYVVWADKFGQFCPAPDFPAAEKRARLERMRHYKHLARQAAPWVAGVLIAGGVAFLALWLRRRRRPAGASGQA